MTLAFKKLRVGKSQRQLIRFFASIALGVGLLFSVQFELTFLAVILALASKWQVVLGGPRLWLHNIWDNAADLTFLMSIIALLHVYNQQGFNDVMLGLLGLYLMWQILIKPLSGVVGHGVQALVMLIVAVTAILIFKSIIGLFGVLVLSWLVALVAADHFLISITDDSDLRYLLMAVWSLVVVQLVWLLGRWSIFYPFLDGRVVVPQAALVVMVLAYVYGSIYYDHHQKRLDKKRLSLHLGLLGVVTLILIVGSDWIQQL